MEIHRTVGGNEYAFELSPEELRLAYNEMKDTYMRLNIDSMLEKTKTLTFRGQDRQAAENLSTALFKGSERFYNDIIFRKEKQESHLEDYRYAMNDVLSENGSDYIKLIIEERFADKDLFFLDPSGDIRWITYNPDSSAGGQFIDITFSQNTLRQAYASEEKIDEYILSRCSASIIDADKVGFIEYADCIAQKSPDWNDFNSVVNDVIIQTKKEGKSMANENISKQKNDGAQPSDRYTIRADKDPFGASVYFGYKDNRQYTDAEDTIYDLLEHNPEYANTQVIENSLMKGFISDEDYADAALIVMTAKEKAAHIEAVEMAMDWNDTYEPAVSKADYLLYEKLIDERANQIRSKEQIPMKFVYSINFGDETAYYRNDGMTVERLKSECITSDKPYMYGSNNGIQISEAAFAAISQSKNGIAVAIDTNNREMTVYSNGESSIQHLSFDEIPGYLLNKSENDILLLKEAGYFEKTNGICAIAEYKNGNRVPYFYENFENDPGLERAVHQLDNNKGVVSYTLYSDGKPVPLSEINAVREKNYPVSNSRSENFKWIPGMEISKQRYEEMYNVLPPLHLKNVCGFQSSEPYSHAENPSTGAFEPTFMTFVNIGDKYFYAGTNFAHEVNQAQYDNIINSINAGQAQTKTPASVNKTNPFDAFSSPLDAFRENARQFNLARIAAKEAKASILEYTDIEGRTHKRYWNGAAFTDRASSLYEREHSGVFKAQFELPGNTTPNTGQTKPPVICKPKGRR